MAKEGRKLATIRTIDSITPIEGADRIECAHIGGWTVVVGKNEFHPGQAVVYFEVDSFLPKSNPTFAPLMERSVKTMLVDGKEIEGHALRTARLRGQYSQGLVMPISAFPQLGLEEFEAESLAKRHADVTKTLGIIEFEKPLPAGSVDIIRHFDNSLVPKTDAERVQNLDIKTFNAIRECDYFASVKVDGTSITMAASDDQESIRVFSHNYEISPETGIGATALSVAKESGLADIIIANPRLVFQMELCGPSIQSNRLRLAKHRLFLFSVWDRDEQAYLSPYAVTGSLSKSLCTPLVDIDLNDFNSPDELLAHVDGIRSNITKDALDEGIVVHIIGRGSHGEREWPSTKLMLENELGPQMQMKAISNRYLLKEK